MPLMSPFTNQQRYTSESVQKENQMYNILKRLRLCILKF